jgi:hypothetical protein
MSGCRGKTRQRASRSRLEGSAEAKKLAVVVLETLAGVRTPVQAAQAAGISPQRYYVLETRSLQAVVRSLEPRRRGRQRGSEERLAEVVREKERLERDLRRTQALLRSAQRVIGVQTGAAHDRSGKSAGRTRRRRRPVARAVKAVALLRAPDDEPQSGEQPVRMPS